MQLGMGMKIARGIPGALFVAAVPLFLITATVTWAVNDLRLYEYGFDKYDVSIVTGIDDEGLAAAGRQIRGYFNSRREPLAVTAVAFGEERELFNEREVAHMRDVKRLIWGVYGAGAVSAAYLLGFVAAGYLTHRRSFTGALARHLLWGGGATLGLVAAIGLGALMGFESLFRSFHELSFANDLWMLDPRTDYLVMMFPQGFWFDATLFVALAIVVETIVLCVASAGYLALLRRRARAPLLQHPSKATGPSA